MRRLKHALLVLAAVAILAALATAPRALTHVAALPELGPDVDAWIAERESAAERISTIIPDTEKRIRWLDPDARSRTPISVVYFHGFSATRQEVAPVAERIAERLGANLFETRLKGHGLTRNALANVRAEDWLDDAAEALAVGAAIGERVVVMGTSTGATLALAMVDHPTFHAVSSVILISPNFAPSDSSAEILTWPGGPQLARLLVGETRSWTAANAEQEQYWSTTYPVAATVEMMRLVKLVRSLLPMTLSQSVLTLYSPNDEVIDTAWIVTALDSIDSPRKETITIERSGDPSNHVLAGDILAPENNNAVVTHIVRFISADKL